MVETRKTEKLAKVLHNVSEVWYVQLPCLVLDTRLVRLNRYFTPIHGTEIAAKITLTGTCSVEESRCLHSRRDHVLV